MKINRLFEIIYLLIEKESITAKELAEKFEVSTRTIYRDVEILSSVGIPIYMTKGRGGGIALLPNYILDKTVLTDKERENILSSLRAVQSVDIADSNSKQELIQMSQRRRRRELGQRCAPGRLPRLAGTPL